MSYSKFDLHVILVFRQFKLTLPSQMSPVQALFGA